MTNVNSSAVRHALNQTTAAREAIGYFIQRILQQFNNVNHSWNDQQSRRLYAIVLDSVTSLRTSYGELRSLEESLKKTLDTVEKYEQIGRATRTTAAAGVAAAASVASAGTKTAVSIRPSIKQDKPFSSPNIMRSLISAMGMLFRLQGRSLICLQKSYVSSTAIIADRSQAITRLPSTAFITMQQRMRRMCEGRVLHTTTNWDT